MHVIIATLIGIATLIFWLSRAARGASDLADSANEIANLPRRFRYRKKAGKRGLDLIDDPVDAATVLMISIARMDGTGRVSDAQAFEIGTKLMDNMQLSREAADDIVLQMRSLSQYLVQADSSLFPMLSVLQRTIGKEDAQDLAQMMRDIGALDGGLNTEQINFIRRYEDRMGLLG